MRTIPVWRDHVSDPSTSAPHSIYSLAFSPNGEHLLVAAGSRVLVYDGNDGKVIQTLKGHKDVVYCVAYAANGEMFASGGADKTVILWGNNLEGMLKYMHTDAVQCLAFNPVTHHLLSCAVTELAIWSSQQKAVNKCKMSAKPTCCSWTSDGQHFAVGLQSGVISIRNKAAEEKVCIDNPNSSPVWSLLWNPTRDESYDILCVCDWNQKLSFFQLTGKQIGKERPLNHDACCITHYQGGDFLLIGGSNKKVSLFSREGVLLGTIADVDSLVWCVQSRPGQNHLAIGCDDGSLIFVHLVFNTVHGLYRERYAYRENMTDVVVKHLLTEQKVRIKCRDLVKKIAIYKSRLAVQLQERIVVYELHGSESSDMQYRVRDKIQQRIDCTLLVVCTNHVVLCQDKRLLCFDFSGEREREWAMDCQIRYIKVIGGPPSREGLLVGLKDGQVFSIYLDNILPVLVLKHQIAIRCLDLSACRLKLAIVDDNSTCVVYDMKTKAILFQEPNANSVAWNTLHSDMMCFTGNGFLSIKANDFPIHQQRQTGFVVGYHGSKIFCLNYSSISATDVPQSASMLQYLEKKMFSDAYSVACLGVAEEDWKVLAFEALENLEFDVARKALIKLKLLPYLELIQSIMERRKRGEGDDHVFLGDIKAHQGLYSDAAKLYKKANESCKAVDMFTDLRMFDMAKEYMDASNAKSVELLKKQADWYSAMGDPKSACEMYMAAGELTEAANLMIDNGWIDQLLQLVRNPSNRDSKLLNHCARLFEKVGQLVFAAEVLEMLGDWEKLVNVYISAQQWEQAFSFLKDHPKLKDRVYFPYAMWLLESDRFNEAQEALSQAGKQHEAIGILKQLASNAILEDRYDDAAYYHWLLATSYKRYIVSENKPNSLVANFWNSLEAATMYYAYNGIHKSMEQPFTSHLPEALFNMGRFLYHKLFKHAPLGISKVYLILKLHVTATMQTCKYVCCRYY
jgi:intraflagellar transport protein 122